MTIEPLSEAHWPAVKSIYEAGIATGNATFTTAAPSWEEWDRSHLPHSRLVAVDAGYGHTGQVLGWAALSPVSSRCVYGGVAELSIYIAAGARGQGVGRQLLRASLAAVGGRLLPSYAAVHSAQALRFVRQQGFEVADAALSPREVPNQLVADFMGQGLELVQDGGDSERGHSTILLGGKTSR